MLSSIDEKNKYICRSIYKKNNFLPVFKYIPYIHFPLEHGSQLGNFVPRVQLTSVWRHFWLLYLSRGWHATRIEGVEGSDVVKYPTMHRTAPITKNYLLQNDNSVKIEKPRIIA